MYIFAERHNNGGSPNRLRCTLIIRNFWDLLVTVWGKQLIEPAIKYTVICTMVYMMANFLHFPIVKTCEGFSVHSSGFFLNLVKHKIYLTYLTCVHLPIPLRSRAPFQSHLVISNNEMSRKLLIYSKWHVEQNHIHHVKIDW